MPLTITRRRGDTIVMTCGEHTITVTFAGVGDAEARVLVDAPPEVRVMRGELVQPTDQD